jgi:nucleoside-diphosphate-sugar epimerase
MNKISILGCGWLGFPLAQYLIENDFCVKGSTTSAEKFDLFLENKITPFAINLTENEIKGEIDTFLHASEVLIIAIPPKLRKSNTENFVSKIQLLIPHIQQSTIQKVLFISSTAVYGENQPVVDENSPTNPETESGKQLLEAEQLLQSKFSTTIIRFGGLIGPNRNPARFLSGQHNLENPDAPVNLIHLHDCISIIYTILQKQCWGATFNAVAPQHPTRKAYYTNKATELGLPLPQFQHTNNSIGKTVHCNALYNLLDYTFQKEI